MIHRIVNHYFSCVLLLPACEYTFNSSRFVPLIFNQSICNYWTDSWWDLFSLQICILLGFSLMQLSRSYWLSYFKVTLWEFELISNYHLSTTKRTTYPTDINTTSHHCLYVTPTQPYPYPPLILHPFAKMYKKWEMFHFFYKRMGEE